MQQQTLDKRWKIPDGVHWHARASLVGVLDEQPVLQAVRGPRKRVANGVVRVGDFAVPVTAWNDAAADFAAINAGAIVEIEGALRFDRWTIGGLVSRQRAVVEAMRVKAIGKAERA